LSWTHSPLVVEGKKSEPLWAASAAPSRSNPDIMYTQTQHIEIRHYVSFFTVYA
jgi:hypothetical protein